MKINTLIIITILPNLLSFPILCAQANNRLEIRGDRLEATENQTTEYRLKDRLEMPLQRQEMEDSRWKMEVEAQGCSFQEIEGSVINGIEYKDVDNQSSLLANNSVSISNLPSSISYLGVTPKLMMDPVSAEEVGKALKEKVLGKEAPSGVDKSGDKFHTATARIEARADEDIIRIKTARERVDEAAAVRTGFVELVKNDAKNRSAFISELQQIWASDIVSTSSEVTIKLVVDTRYEALKADLIAIEAKTEAHKMDFDKELKAYKETAEAWNKTAIACNQAFPSVNTINIASNSNKEIEELTTLLKTAEVRASAWTAHIPWVKAREKELAIKDLDHITEEEAVSIEEAWEDTVEGAQRALDKLDEVNIKLLTTCEELKINTLLKEAKIQQERWAAQIPVIHQLTVQGTQIIGVNREDLLLQEIKKNRVKSNKLARKAVWSGQNQQTYTTWELPKIPNFLFSSFDQTIEERTSEGIEPPEILNEKLEEKGRQLLRSERAFQKVREAVQKTAIMTAPAITTTSVQMNTTGISSTNF